MKTYICGKCKKNLTLNNFHKDSNKRGHYSICKKCKAKNRSVIRDMLQNAKKRVKKRNWDFDITIDFLIQLNIKQNSRCAYTNEKLNWKIASVKGIRLMDRASLDRIDPTKGYTKDNVHLIMDFVNRMKSNRTEKEFVRICRLIIEKWDSF